MTTGDGAARRYPVRPLVGLGAAIVVRPEDRRLMGLPDDLPSTPGVVLVKRRFEPLAGHWSLPGGLLEVGETLMAGMAREILEETGLVVSVGPVLDVFDWIDLDDGGRVRHHYVLIDYVCRPVAGTLRAGSDVSDAVVAGLDRLDEYGVTSTVRDVVAKALSVDR